MHNAIQVCDTHGTITFGTWDMAALLGLSTRKLVGTKLDTLLPPPYNSMHTKWLQDTPTTVPSNSCRAGVVVNLMNSSRVLVPVRIKVHQMEDQARTLHVIRVSVHAASPTAAVHRCVSLDSLVYQGPVTLLVARSRKVAYTIIAMQEGSLLAMQEGSRKVAYTILAISASFSDWKPQGHA